MKTKTVVYTALAVAAVAAFFYYKKRMRKAKRATANKKPDGMMNADGADRQKRKEQRRANRESRRETNRAIAAVASRVSFSPR